MSDESKLTGVDKLNADLDIPFMEAKGAYHIISKICNLEHIGNGIFKASHGNVKYVLTKYGFRHNTDYNYQVRYAETIAELRKLRSDYSVLESNCNNKINGSIKY